MNKYRDFEIRTTSHNTLSRPVTVYSSRKAGRIIARPDTGGEFSRPLKHSQTEQQIKLPSSQVFRVSTQQVLKFPSINSPTSVQWSDQKDEQLDSSQYSINLHYPTRPLTSSISSLSYRENLKVARDYNKEVFEPWFIQVAEYDISGMAQKIPTNKEFTRVLDRLERIAFNKSQTHRRLVIRDGKTADGMITQGENQFIKVPAKGKKCPLRIQIKRAKGRLITFMSKSVPEPTSELCDESTRMDYHEFADLGVKFKCESIFICLHALEDTIFNIFIAFGRAKVDLVVNNKRHRGQGSVVQNIEQLKQDENMRVELQKNVEIAIAKRKQRTLQLANCKNFITLNKQIQSPSSPIRQQRSQEKVYQQKARLLAAQEKKALNIIHKKQRTIAVLNKREAKRQEEVQRRKDAKALLILKKKQRMWLIYMNLIRMAVVANIKFQTKRSHVFERIQQSFSVRKIQRLFRESIRGLQGPDLVKLRARNLLLLYSMHGRTGVMHCVQRKMTMFLRESAQIHLIPHRFTGFCKKMELIQKHYRLYQQKQKDRKQYISQIWDQTLEKLIFDSTKLKAGRRRGAKETDYGKYTKISLIAKNRVLQEYMRDCKFRFRAKLKDYVFTKKKLQFRVELARRDQHKQHEFHLEDLLGFNLPTFDYIPSNNVILELIEKASNIF